MLNVNFDDIKPSDNDLLSISVLPIGDTFTLESGLITIERLSKDNFSVKVHSKEKEYSCESQMTFDDTMNFLTS